MDRELTIKGLTNVNVEQILAYDAYDKIALYMYATVYAKKHRVYYRVLMSSGHFTEPIQTLEKAMNCYNLHLTVVEEFEAAVARIKYEIKAKRTEYSSFYVNIEGTEDFRAKVAQRVVNDLNLRGHAAGGEAPNVLFLMPQ